MSNPMIRTVSTTLDIIREIDPHTSISRGLIEQEIKLSEAFTYPYLSTVRHTGIGFSEKRCG